MVALLGHPPLRLIRIGIGPLQLGDLRPGKWRDLTPGEIAALRDAVYRGAVSGGAVSGGAQAGDERKVRPLIPSTIAIDGPSASGKSTVGGLLASELGYLYFDTGVMYRAVAAVALARRVPVDDEAAVTALAEQVCLEVQAPTIADGRDVTVLADGQDITWDIRRREVEKAVSPVSAYPGVREAMRIQQRRIGEKGRIVMVGRDIGTVVLPDADLKIYLDATLTERARRRFLERQHRGETVSQEQVLHEVRRRDEYDSTRQHAPLMAASDAIVLDSTDLTVDQVLERLRVLLRPPGSAQPRKPRPVRPRLPRPRRLA
jgi:cytidylate kinase